MSLKVRKTTILLIVGVMLVTLASSAALAAGRVEVSSRVTLEQDYAFHGNVLSKREACERNRTVAVYQVRPGVDGLYDTTKSNAEGEWEILAGAPNGEFYAVAKARSIDKGTTTLVCKRTESPVAEF
jgi:hypothetical protein